MRDDEQRAPVLLSLIHIFIDSGVRSAVKYIREVFSLMEQKGTFGYSDF